MPQSVERLLKVNEVVEQVPLVLEMFFNADPAVETVFHCAPTCSEACLFFGYYFLSLGFQSVEDDTEHDLAGVADQAYCSIVLALSKISLLW